MVRGSVPGWLSEMWTVAIPVGFGLATSPVVDLTGHYEDWKE